MSLTQAGVPQTPEKECGDKKTGPSKGLPWHSDQHQHPARVPSKELDDVVTLGRHGLLDKAFALLSRPHLT